MFSNLLPNFLTSSLSFSISFLFLSYITLTPQNPLIIKLSTFFGQMRSNINSQYLEYSLRTSKTTIVTDSG